MLSTFPSPKAFIAKQTKKKNYRVLKKISIEF